MYCGVWCDRSFNYSNRSRGNERPTGAKRTADAGDGPLYTTDDQDVCAGEIPGRQAAAAAAAVTAPSFQYCAANCSAALSRLVYVDCQLRRTTLRCILYISRYVTGTSLSYPSLTNEAGRHWRKPDSLRFFCQLCEEMPRK